VVPEKCPPCHWTVTFVPTLMRSLTRMLALPGNLPWSFVGGNAQSSGFVFQQRLNSRHDTRTWLCSFFTHGIHIGKKSKPYREPKLHPLDPVLWEREGAGSRSEIYGLTLLFRAENELLHAPVQQFADVDFVFRWACDFVDPSELFELSAGLTKHAQDLAIQADLVDSAGESVGCV
jgi:hypothetical protein